jgi:signal recognition particle receptor subunit alpha
VTSSFSNFKVIGTFEGVASVVKNTLNDSLMQILSPRRRVDILRDALESKRKGRPFVMTFCGVNGVGKSTNLAKVLLCDLFEQVKINQSLV